MVHPAATAAVVLTSGVCFIVGWCIWGVAFWSGTPLEKFLLVLLVVLVLFSGFILYSIRIFLTYIGFLVATGGKTTPKLFLEEQTFRSFVIPSDLDVFLHMNNSRYARASDFARASLFWESGIGNFIAKHKGYFVVAASALRYRRSLKFLQCYKITTKLVYWDDDAFYLEHKFLSKYKDIDDFAYCVMFYKMSVRGMTTSFIRKNFLGMDESDPLPQPSEELRHFVEFNKHSSLALRNKIE